MADGLALPAVFAGALPELWSLADFDTANYPHLLTVTHTTDDSDILTAQIALLDREPSWKVVGYHAGGVESKKLRTKTPGATLVASRRANARTLYSKVLADYVRLGGRDVFGAPLQPSDIAEVRDLPPGLFADGDPEARHMAVHVALEDANHHLVGGWSHLLCPATPIEVLMEIFRTNTDRREQWAYFLDYQGDPRDLKVEMAARLAAQDAKYRDPDYLEHIANVLAEDD